MLESRSRALARLMESAHRIAATELTVLIRGEAGTGKEFLARTIHAASSRKDGPWIKAACAELEKHLALEILAFVADGGTLFFDEVGDIPWPVQNKLRHFLDSNAERAVRVIAATRYDLEKLVASGRFRPELFYRLCVVPMDLPLTEHSPIVERDAGRYPRPLAGALQ